MKKSIMKRWVKALRSGKYKQTGGFLRDGDGFCCLGVLCDLAKNDTGLKWYDVLGENTRKQVYVTGETARWTLPKAVMSWADMQTRSGELPEKKKLSLVDVNDSGWSFEKIADRIEKYWEKL